VKRSDKPEDKATRPETPQPAWLVVSFVDRNWLWSRFGLALSLVLAIGIAWAMLTPFPPGPRLNAGVDKIYHFLAFMALVFPVIVTDTDRWTWVVPAAIGFGGLAEAIQPMVGRNGEWLDLGASVSGVLAGAALAEMLHNRIRRSVIGAETQPRTDLPILSEQERMDAMRAELMAELRAVLREELAAASRRSPSGDTEGGDAMAQPASTRLPRLSQTPTGADDPAEAGGRSTPAPVSPSYIKSVARKRGTRFILDKDDYDYDAGEDGPIEDAARRRAPTPPPERPSNPGDTPLRH